MEQSGELIKGMDRAQKEDKILLCFPFAGGGASAFYSWEKKISDGIKVCAVQLPGREERITEEPYTDMEQLIDDLVCCIKGINNELILFGHSMGAKIAFEVEKNLEKIGKHARFLVVSGSRAPHIPEPNPICHLSDEEFKRELARFDGTPNEILENEELLDFFLPMLKADFTMDEVYLSKEKIELNCPILALGGEDDREATQKEICTWKAYTKSAFFYEIFPGGHFFIRDQEEKVIHFINQKILTVYNGDH